jgi:hypothetical protein
LEFLATGWAGSDYLDLIVRRGYEDHCLDAFTGWLRWRGQTVRFDHLRPGAFAATLGDQLISSGWGRESPDPAFARLRRFKVIPGRVMSRRFVLRSAPVAGAT